MRSIQLNPEPSYGAFLGHIAFVLQRYNQTKKTKQIQFIHLFVLFLKHENF